MKYTSFLISLILIFSILQSCKKVRNKEISFLSFNTWHEGTSVPNGMKKIKDIILEVNPDIVCFVEVRNYKDQDWTSKIVNTLDSSGAKYYRAYAGGDVSFISKYPISKGKLVFGNTNKGTVANFEVNVDGNLILVSGAHLDYTYYASNLPRGYNGGYPDWKLINDGSGKPMAITNIDSLQLYNLKSTRDEAIDAFLNSVNETKLPVFLMGDFNEPSCFDWTSKTANMFDHHGVIIPWHNTKTLDNHGYIDAYRSFYPDEVKYPGISWPAYTHEKGSTSWTPLADERDRIDYIFHKGIGVKIIEVAMVGPKESYVNNKISTANTEYEKFLASDLAWPSDHKAVYVKYSITFND